MKRLSLAALLALLALLPGLIALAPKSPEQSAADEFGERFAEQAQNILALNKQLSPASFKQSAVLLRAAIQECPTEARFHNLLIEACMQIKDPEAVKAALNGYLKVVGDDRVRQLDLIRYYAADKETAEQKFDYLRGLLGETKIPSEVRAEVAVLAAKLQSDRGRDESAGELISQALKLNGVNPEALRMNYARVAGTGAPEQRVAALVALLKANVSQPFYIVQLGQELASVGLSDQAIWCFRTATEYSQMMGQGMGSQDEYTAYAVASFVANQIRGAYEAADQLVTADSSNVEAAMVRFLAIRTSKNEAEMEKARDVVLAGMLQRLSALHARLTQTEATTKPADLAMADMAEDVQKLKQSDTDPALYAAYVAAVADLAWYEIYFNEQPVAATKPIEALRSLLTPEHPILARLDGWVFLMTGKSQEATVKLSAIAEQDALAKLGLVRITESSNPSQARDDLANLAGRNTVGVIGALIAEAARNKEVRPVPHPNAAAARTEYDRFPKDLWNFPSKPDQFYRLGAEPLKVNHVFGEPMLAKISVQNISNYDLSIGPDGMINPDLWVDVKITTTNQQLSGIAYERLGMRFVLPPRGKIERVLRIDNSQLGQLLSSNPKNNFVMNFSVFTNPMAKPDAIVPGMGGQRRQFATPVSRQSAPISNQQSVANFLQLIISGEPGEKIRTAELLGTYISLIRGIAAQAQQGDAEAVKQIEGLIPVGSLFDDYLNRARADDSSRVRAWVNFTLCRLSPPVERVERINRMFNEPDWQSRMTALSAAQSLPPEQQKELAAKLVNDSESVVRMYATTVMETADLMPATTQPTTAESAIPQPTVDTGGNK